MNEWGFVDPALPKFDKIPPMRREGPTPSRQCLALGFDPGVKEAQRYREKPLQRVTLACIEERCGVRIGRSGIAPVFVPAEQLDQRLHALHHVACIVQECGLALPGKIESVALDPFEGFELGGGTEGRARATGVGACV